MHGNKYGTLADQLEDVIDDNEIMLLDIDVKGYPDSKWKQAFDIYLCHGNIDKKLIEYIIKRIDRSYEKIFLFIHKIDKLSLKKGKPINLATIKEALEK